MISRKTTSLSLDRTPLQNPCESAPQTSPLDSILLKGLAKLKSWKLPPNWSAQGWFDEVRQLAWEAACEALCDYKVGATTPIRAFVYLRIMQRVLYPTTAATGTTVLDVEPHGEAAKEIRALMHELKAILN